MKVPNAPPTALWTTTFGMPTCAIARCERGGVGDVAGHRDGVRDLPFKRRKPVGVARQHRYAVAALGEAPHRRGAGAGADAGDQREWFACIGHAAFSSRASSSRTNSSRSLPKNMCLADEDGRRAEHAALNRLIGVGVEMRGYLGGVDPAGE